MRQLHPSVLGPRLLQFVGKMKGTSVIRKGPDALSWSESWYTFLGVFTTILVLSLIQALAFTPDSDNKNLLILTGSFGALCTLVFGLNTAPLAQPRIILLAHLYSSVVAICVNYTRGFFPVYLRAALATALSIAGMVKLGLTNPPAAAAALIYVTSKQAQAIGACLLFPP